MTGLSFLARTMGMSDSAWERHANPWSGWTRLATFPLLFLAIWSHVWIGWWALVPVGILAVWHWLNPRVFPVPSGRGNWMTRGVYGERLWLDRLHRPVPERHRVVPHLLAAASGVGIVIAVIGFVLGAFWIALLGWVIAGGAKLWFVDRMVWLYNDMAGPVPAAAPARADRPAFNPDATGAP